MQRAPWLLAPLFALAVVGAEVHASGEFIYPTSGRLSSTYYSPRPGRIHAAIDIAAPTWARIHSARGGRVTFSGWSSGYGNLVIVDHGSGYQTYYAHMVQRGVSSGANVSTGSLLGYVGSTGNSTGPHLHFEIRRNGAKLYIPGSSGNQVSQGRAIGYTYSGLGPAGGSSPTPTPAPAPSGARWASLRVVEVTASALNLRTGPSTGYRIIGRLGRGQRYVRFATAGVWQAVLVGGQKYGWVHGGYLRMLTSAPVARVSTSVLNVRTGPSTGYSRVGQITINQHFAVVRTSGSWVAIWYDGALRWVHGGYVQRKNL